MMRDQQHDRLRQPPAAELLRQLADAARYAEAADLLESVDLETELSAEFCYYAGVCLGSVGREVAAIRLLKRAAGSGYAAFWCAYHLGLFETRLGNQASAAFYLTLALILSPHQAESILPTLGAIAPGTNPASLAAAQQLIRSRPAAAIVFETGTEERDAGRVGAALYYFTAALVLDPEHAAARAAILRLAPDVLLDLLPRGRDEALADWLDMQDARLRERIERELSRTRGRQASPSTGRNLVLGFATNYTIDALAPFVESLRENYAGEVVLWTTSLDDGTKAFLERHNVATEFHWEGDFIPAHLAMNRFIAYYAFLRRREQANQRADRVLLTDIRDVVFQGDPFVSAPEGELLAYLEEPWVTPATCPINAGWLRAAFGEETVANLADRRVSCSGTVLATWDRMVEYLLVMHQAMLDSMREARFIEGIDQGIHNFLIHSDRLERVTMVENGVHVFTMAGVSEEDVAIANDGKIVDRYGRAAPILHQYDYHPTALRLVDEKYRRGGVRRSPIPRDWSGRA